MRKWKCSTFWKNTYYILKHLYLYIYMLFAKIHLYQIIPWILLGFNIPICNNILNLYTGSFSCLVNPLKESYRDAVSIHHCLTAQKLIYSLIYQLSSGKTFKHTESQRFAIKLVQSFFQTTRKIHVIILKRMDLLLLHKIVKLEYFQNTFIPKCVYVYAKQECL